MSLEEEEKAALQCLLPLIKDDGELHKTNTLPPMVYQTPAHLDFVCSLLPDTFLKKLRLEHIDRKLKLFTIPFSNIKRCRSASGKAMWWFRSSDPHRRYSYKKSIEYVSTGDEARIRKTWESLLWREVGKLNNEGISINSGLQTDMSGRFNPIPQTQKYLEKKLNLLADTLISLGFKVKVANVGNIGGGSK